MKNTLRQYHRLIAPIFCLPLFFTALTGTSIAIADQWLHQEALVAFLIPIHTFQIFKRKFPHRGNFRSLKRLLYQEYSYLCLVIL